MPGLGSNWQFFPRELQVAGWQPTMSPSRQPGKGRIEIGESVKLGYVDQSRDALDGNKTVWEEISGGDEVITLGKREINSRAYTSAFNFKGSDQQKKVGQLSGGERNRVHLAKMLKLGATGLLPQRTHCYVRRPVDLATRRRA
jgi:ATPase subunit of ABC transporter with duplicated ATPase domains